MRCACLGPSVFISFFITNSLFKTRIDDNDDECPPQCICQLLSTTKVPTTCPSTKAPTTSPQCSHSLYFVCSFICRYLVKITWCLLCNLHYLRKEFETTKLGASYEFFFIRKKLILYQPGLQPFFSFIDSLIHSLFSPREHIS